MIANQHLLQILFVFMITTIDRNQATSTICGNYTSFDGTSGTVTSPNYPNDYTNSLNCSYTIEVAEGSSANITFEEFILELTHDWVQIRCSNGSNPYVSGRYTGQEKPPFMSFRSCRQITVLFHTDSSVTYRGFSLNYTIGEGISGGIISEPRNFYFHGHVTQQIQLSCESNITLSGTYPWWSFSDGTNIRSVTTSTCALSASFSQGQRFASSSPSRGPNSTSCNLNLMSSSSDSPYSPYMMRPHSPFGIYICTDSSLSTVTSLITDLRCGNTSSFDGTSGTITSPGYPNPYSHALDCSYTIEVEDGDAVNITFEDFLTEFSSDWVQIRCSNGSNPYVSARYSGREAPPFMSFRSCAQLTVLFHSNGYASYRGFSLNYTVGEGVSGGVTATPKNYFSHTDSPQQIQLSCVSNMTLSGSYPWWSFSDGTNIRPITNSTCGLSASFSRDLSYASSSKSRGPNSSVCNLTLTVSPSYMHSPYGTYICTDSSLSTATSLITYQRCGNTSSFDGSSGTITSPGYPNPYSHALECFYTIEVEEGHSVNITFEDFLTESYSDWVQIRCSNGSNSYVSARYSGRERPPFMSFRSCRQLRVQFHTDYGTSYMGFRLTYSVGRAGLSGRITTAPRNFYPRSDSSEPVVLQCASSISVNGSYPWWTYSDGRESRPVTNSLCESVNSYLDGGIVVQSTSKSLSSNSSACNIILTVSPGSFYSYNYYYRPPLTIFTCTDSSLSNASALVARFPYSVSTDRDNNGKEIVKGDNVTITCSHPPLPPLPTGHQLYLSTHFSSPEQDFIPNTTTSQYSSSITVKASSEVLPSYACHFNFSFSGNSVVGNMATNLPEDFTLVTKHHEVLFWPENETMTVIGALNGKIDKDGVLTCHAPANPTPMYKWVEVASGKSSAGPSVHVLRSGNYTCVATNFIRRRIYIASTTVGLEIVGSVSVKKEAAAAVGVVLGVIGLIFMGIFAAAFVLLNRKLTSLKDSVSQNVHLDTVTSQPVVNATWEINCYEEHDKAALVT